MVAANTEPDQKADSAGGRLTVSRSGDIATITIDHAGKRNALTAAMWAQFAPVLAELADDPGVTVLVVRGAGADFSAGADIGDLDAILTGESDGGVMTEAEDALAAFPKPTIAAIDGHCVGGGWELAGACDLRICSDRSTFGVTPSRLGIVYPRSGIERLVAIAGPAVAKHLLFSGELVSPQTAAAWGLVTKVLPAEGFWDAVGAFASLIVSRSQFSIRATKEIVDAVAAGGDGVAEAVARWLATPSGDRAIGVAAFLGKRPPEFTWGSGTP
ncbi:enoyl-CoA hydratase/carnithine racemase [Cryobacterium mesophilum]|uniref:enoyl-CoA hydratase/isomerase family protein n=1 Tax=Terrimesophilobacter mesophilus TaxID=433647 RepID=UPI001809D998|nr:enoyl-CoA hydratase/isomerase family protein [Terrimesophilobacter mesophilus]MBB5632707.1 enoyl-CoA hydratase/carnithine racemase [Terrimesophilobacter mesophilus]